MALVQCPNCKTQVTAVSARCFSCGYPMPRQRVVEPPKTPKPLQRAYLAGSAMVVIGFVLRSLVRHGVADAVIVIGVVVIIGSAVARAFMNWIDKPTQP